MVCKASRASRGNDMMCASSGEQNALKRLPPPSEKRENHRARNFKSNEEGGMTIIALFVFILMLCMGGISVDLMRHELERAQIQATLDAAVLAGAGAPAGATEDDIREIVTDFFVKSGKGDYLNDIGDGDIVAHLNSRSVHATAGMTMNTYLMKLMGVHTLSASGASTAAVRTPKLEISLVLDVSGSMSGTKLANLQVAAKEFVTTILNTSAPGTSSISIVPFSWGTSPGPAIYSAMAANIETTHTYSSCLRFSADDYAVPYIDPTPDASGPHYMQQIYTAVYGGFDALSSGWRGCFNNNYAEILAYSMSEADLHAKIEQLTASGNTSGHIGMKWGAALLDPAFRPVAGSLINQGVMDASLNNVPAAYGEPDTRKIIVMMGDGANTNSYYFDANSNYRGPGSNLYRVVYQDMQFAYARNLYNSRISYDQSLCTDRRWECHYEPSGPEQNSYYLRNGTSYYSIDDANWVSQTTFDGLSTTIPGYIDSIQLDWEEAWGHMSPDYYRSITGDSGPWNDYVGSETEYGSTKNTHMRSICSATKNQGVTVYTIGFEVPENGTAETELRNCASTTQNYYRASGVNISDAFGSIASNVQSLRLTQ